MIDSSSFGFALITAPVALVPTFIAFSVGHKHRYMVASINIAFLIVSTFLSVILMLIGWLFLFGYVLRGDNGNRRGGKQEEAPRSEDV